MAVAHVVLPRVYIAYMRLVWKTSRVELCGWERAPEIRDRHDGFVAMLWHEEVFSVAWSYRDVNPHTLASIGDSGEMITRILELCGYVVFRGGSSARKSRRRDWVLIQMIRHIQATHRVVYGVTVDGSKGPLHEMKPGALFIARAGGKPLVLVRTWAKWNLRLPTWDRMAVPLPFNHIRQYLLGPYFLPENAKDAEVFETFRSDMEQKLAELAKRSEDWR